MPVVSGLISDRGWMAEAMGVEPAELLARFQDAALDPLPWQEVKSAPVQEVVHREVDLAKLLPLPTHNEHDSALRHRGIDDYAQSAYRAAERLDPSLPVERTNRLGVLLLPRHAHMFFEMAEQQGAPLDAAIVVGVDPLTLLASQAIAPMDVDELDDRWRAAGTAAAGGEMPRQRIAGAGRSRDRHRGPLPAACA